MKGTGLLLLGATLCFAQSPSPWQNFMLSSPSHQFAWIAPQDAVQDTTVADSLEDEGEEEYIDYKSPKKAFFLSALVPGAGQVYNNTYLKAAAFLAVEAAAWTMYMQYDKKGKDLDTEFRAYADQHWSENEYWDYIAKFSGLSRNDVEALRSWEQTHFSHGLHREKDQQYYEMIGKYDQFNYGWDDSDVGLLDEGWKTSLRSKNRLDYEDQRHDSNASFKTATTMSTIAIVNHIVSGLEAAWYASAYNRAQYSAQLRLEPRHMDGRPYTALSLNLTW
jgi:hypothetical protein